MKAQGAKDKGEDGARKQRRKAKTIIEAGVETEAQAELEAKVEIGAIGRDGSRGRSRGRRRRWKQGAKAEATKVGREG